jgi:hypothetical protein
MDMDDFLFPPQDDWHSLRHCATIRAHINGLMFEMLIEWNIRRNVAIFEKGGQRSFVDVPRYERITIREVLGMNNIFFDRAEINGNGNTENVVENILSTPVEDVHSHVTIEIWMIEPTNIPNIPIG